MRAAIRGWLRCSPDRRPSARALGLRIAEIAASIDDRPDERPPGEAPKPDDELGMAWWNHLSEQERRRWMRLAGDTGRAVDAWNAFKGARLAERELDPRDVIAEILEEHLMPDPRAVADVIVEHLRDAGFEIRPIDPKRRA